jgi:hypothetical protein
MSNRKIKAYAFPFMASNDSLLSFETPDEFVKSQTERLEKFKNNINERMSQGFELNYLYMGIDDTI